MSVDLTTLTRTGVVTAQLSSNYPAAGFDASRAIDGSYDTICATAETTAGSNWLAVRPAAGTKIGVIAMYNRRDYLATGLGSIQVWLGSAPGDTSSGESCGSVSYTATAEPSPYLTFCGGASADMYPWVTLLQTACVSSECLLALAEVEVCTR